jgi:ABC-type transport system involved in multi-copper enzyme maturation permease subunit
MALIEGFMSKNFIYSRLNIFFGYGLLLVFFVVMGFVIIISAGIPTTRATWIIAGSAYFLIFICCAAIITWIVIVLKINICVDDKGITYLSPFRKVDIEWQNIQKIDRRYFYSGSFPMGGPPRDLEFRSKTGDIIRVFHFIVNSETLDVEEGLADFESEIKKHINLVF